VEENVWIKMAFSDGQKFRVGADLGSCLLSTTPRWYLEM